MADPSSPPIAVRVAARSDVGMRRPANQDAVAVLPKPNGQPHAGDVFLMVADGMGGHAAGEIASRIAVDTIPPAFCRAEGRSAPSALRTAVQAANTRINTKGAECPEHQDMGTTCSCLVLSRGAGLVAHVGDSRVYRLRDGVLEQLTFDHSLVWELAAASDVSEDKVPSYIPKNVITRSLGPKASVQVDIEGPQELRVGDVFLLCSDGLSGVVEDGVIGGVLATLDPDAAVEALVDFANIGGGPDNVSAVVARVERCDSANAGHTGAPPSQRWPWAVIAAVACLAACGWFLLQGHVTGMIVSAVCLGASIVAALLRGDGDPLTGAPPVLGGPYGDGPYRRCECGDGAEASRLLGERFEHLRNGASAATDVAATGAAAVDWATHEAVLVRAAQAPHAEAIALYAAAAREVLRAIREDDGTHRYPAAKASR